MPGLLFLTLAGCAGDSATVHLSGSTMGTTWTVTYQGGIEEQRVQQLVEQQLDLVNRSMSTYSPDSEISHINAAPPDVWIELSAPFAQVLEAALAIGRDSGGAYDITVGPLVDLWGFGPETTQGIPQAEQIAAALKLTGQQTLAFDLPQKRLLKQRPLRLDFSSLAKGYAVDRVAQALQESAIQHFLVEIGGEMRASGLSPRQDKWRIAIEQPAVQARDLAAAIRLTDISVATSGDYRNYFEYEGQRYSHSIDPRTGWPVAHELVSVTVLHTSAMLADAWATALTVMGPEQGPALAQQQGLAVYFIQRDGDGFLHSYTKAFEPYLEERGT